MVASLDTSNQDRYFLTGECLGKGQYGVVRACVDILDGRLVACKSIPHKRLESVKMEISIMHILPTHPNIVVPEMAFQDSTHVHIIMEKCPLGDLLNLIQMTGYLPEQFSAPMFRKMMVGLSFCHSNDVIHCDLKPENILLGISASGEVEPKIADFGLARLSTFEPMVSEFAGSVPYVAPEIFLGRAHSMASDVWSMGVVLYAMLSGKMPFEGTEASEVLGSILKGRPDTTSDRWKDISPSAKDVILRMLHTEPGRRPSAAQVLRHPWIANLKVSCPMFGKDEVAMIECSGYMTSAPCNESGCLPGLLRTESCGNFATGHMEGKNCNMRSSFMPQNVGVGL